MDSPSLYSPPFTRKKRRESLLPGPPTLSLRTPCRKRARNIHAENLEIIGEDETSSDEESLVNIVLSPKVVMDTTMELFGSSGLLVSTEESGETTQPSIAASLFSSFAILRQKTSQSIAPILPFLKSLVEIEHRFNGVRETSKRKVKFASIDGSCILPPVDRDPDSLLPQQGAIEGLQAAMETVLALSPTCVPLLQELVDFLASSSETDQVVELPGVVDCSRRQFRSHLSTYRDDFCSILGRLSNVSEAAITPMKHAALRSIDQPLKSVEVLLADRIGSAIRYHLRMLFNTVPPTISSKTTQPQVERYSLVCNLVKFEGHEYGDVVASALISLSLRILRDSYGLPSLMGHERISLPTGFFTSKSSTLKVPKNAQPGICAVQDFDIVEQDLVNSLEFVESSRACRFLVDLWTQPGVKEELERVGGLDLVETYASMSWNYDLYKIRPENAHLVALCNISQLMSQLVQWKTLMEPLEHAALEGAQKIVKNYRFTTKSKKILTAYPLITRLKNVYDETMSSIEKIPVVIKA